MDDFELFRKLAMCEDKEQMARVIEEHNNAQKPMTNADCTGLCETCLHAAVCAKRAATGGNVQNCQHYAEERHGRWINEGDGDWRCSVCRRLYTFDDYGDIDPKEDCGCNYCPNCGAKMDGGNDDG